MSFDETIQIPLRKSEKIASFKSNFTKLVFF